MGQAPLPFKFLPFPQFLSGCKTRVKKISKGTKQTTLKKLNLLFSQQPNSLVKPTGPLATSHSRAAATAAAMAIHQHHHNAAKTANIS